LPVVVNVGKRKAGTPPPNNEEEDETEVNDARQRTVVDEVVDSVAGDEEVPVMDHHTLLRSLLKLSTLR